MTVHSRRHAHVLLRRGAASNQSWYKDRRSVANGDKVRIVDHGVDENGYAMLKVEPPDSSDGGGWIYAINIREFQ